MQITYLYKMWSIKTKTKTKTKAWFDYLNVHLNMLNIVLK